MNKVEKSRVFTISVDKSHVIQPILPDLIRDLEVLKSVSNKPQENNVPQDKFILNSDKCIIKSIKAIGLGVPQIIFGMVCLVLNVYIIKKEDGSENLFDFTYGIWSGAVFIFSGLLEVLTRNVMHCKFLRMITVLTSSGIVFVAMLMIPFVIVDLIYDPTKSSFVANCTNTTKHNVQRPELFYQACITFTVMGFLEMLLGVLTCALYSKSFLCDMSKVTHSIYDVITAPVTINKELTKFFHVDYFFSTMLILLQVTLMYIFYLNSDFIFYLAYFSVSLILFMCLGTYSCFCESETKYSKEKIYNPPNFSTIASAIVILLHCATAIVISYDIRTDLIDHNFCKKGMNFPSKVKFGILAPMEALSLLLGALRLIQFCCWLICRKTIIEYNKNRIKRNLENLSDNSSVDCSANKTTPP